MSAPVKKLNTVFLQQLSLAVKNLKCLHAPSATSTTSGGAIPVDLGKLCGEFLSLPLLFIIIPDFFLDGGHERYRKSNVVSTPNTA